MGGCEFIDSTGLGVITGALKRAMDAGGTAVLADLQPRVGEALRMTGLARVIAIFAAVDEAVSALAGEEAGR
jgi:anti-sigma B factor antagonist